MQGCAWGDCARRGTLVLQFNGKHAGLLRVD
jgi:hypothetical protein